MGTSIEDNIVAWRADELRKVPALIRFISYEPALGPIDLVDLTDIDWLIYGGESGPNFRPAEPSWPREIRDRCAAEGIAFFHKQSEGQWSGMNARLDGVLHHTFPRKSRVRSSSEDSIAGDSSQSEDADLAKAAAPRLEIAAD
jgi:protein gp37